LLKKILPNERHTSGHSPRHGGAHVFFSAFATTRAAARGFKTLYKLGHTLNMELAKAAKVSGTKVSLLISSAGTSKNSMFNYLNIKPG
jgi:hypothetical protein